MPRDYDDDDDRPARRPRRDDDDDDRPRRPRRRDDDDDYDRRRGGPVELGPLDSTYRDTNFVVLILFSVCCSGIAAILALVGYLTAKDEKAKSNAMISLIIGGAIFVLASVSRFVLGVGPFGGR